MINNLKLLLLPRHCSYRKVSLSDYIYLDRSEKESFKQIEQYFDEREQLSSYLGRMWVVDGRQIVG